jgi:glutamine amidotransferase-like uncharacterized protein
LTRHSPRRIAVFVGKGAPKDAANAFLEVCASEEGLEIQKLEAREIRDGALTKFAVVVFPGGSGSLQASDLESNGCQAVRRFVEKGGGYLGVCGGAFLSTSHYPWSLGILNAAVLTSPPDATGDQRTGLWYRGDPKPVLIELSDEGKALLGVNLNELMEVCFHNGPIISSGLLKTVAPFNTLAYYRSEVFRNEAQRGTMIQSPAIVSGLFGAGRVIAIGPHLETDCRHFPLLVKFLRWLSQ